MPAQRASYLEEQAALLLGIAKTFDMKTFDIQSIRDRLLALANECEQLAGVIKEDLTEPNLTASVCLHPALDRPMTRVVLISSSQCRAKAQELRETAMKTSDPFLRKRFLELVKGIRVPGRAAKEVPVFNLMGRGQEKAPPDGAGPREELGLSARFVVKRRRRIAEVDSRARVFPAPLFVAPFPPSVAFMMFTPLAAITPIVVVSLGRSNTCNADDSDCSEGHRHAAQGAPSRLRDSLI
jgi:hypothetical protein